MGLVAGCVASASAAEWSYAPALSWLADHHSNRVLREDGLAGESLGANLDVAIVRRAESSEITVRPHYRLQRFSDDVMPDVDDWQLGLLAIRRFENSTLDFDARAAEESTLTTELAETGFVLADSNRRTYAGGVGWQLAHSENNQFNASLGLQDVDYTGANEDLLAGYRYVTASAGETFGFSPRAAFLVTAFGSELRSPERDSTSREYGMSLGVNYAWSERTEMSLSLGVSRRNTDGRQDTGTTRDFSLRHNAGTLDWSLAYSHSLQPFGTGILTERDTAQLQVVKALSPRMNTLLRAGYTRNEDAGFGLTFDSREYRYADAELRWQLRETWNLAVAAGYAAAKQGAFGFAAADDVDGWKLTLRTSWAPRARVFGH